MKKIFTLGLVLLFVAMAVFANGTIEYSEVLEETPRIAVVSAFGPEITLLLESTEVQDTFVVNGRTFTTGSIGDDEVVVFYSGVSMINAAMTMQLAFDNFNVERVVFSGIAGGVDAELNIGDVVVPDQWAQYQEAVFAREVEPGVYDAGWHDIPFANYGMIFPQTVGVTSDRVAPDETEEIFWFQSDPEMIAVAREMDVELLSNGLSYPPKMVVGGNGVSGMTFVDNAEYRLYVQDTFDASCLDMESAAIAHVAYANEVPFVVFRALSDLAGGGEGENEIGTFFGIAAENSAKVLLAWFDEWSN